MENYGKNVSTDKVFENVLKNKNIFFALFLTLLVCAAGVYFYLRRQVCLREEGTFLLARMIEIRKNAKPENLEFFLQEAESLIIKSEKTEQYPFLLAQKASVLAKSGQFDQASNLFDIASQKVKNNLFAGLYAVKKCYFKILQNKETLLDEALSELKELSLVSHPVAKKLALYVLHQYYWTRSDFEKALVYGSSFLKQANLEDSKEISLPKLSEIVSNNLNLISVE